MQSPSFAHRADITGIVLAGGRARRMGGVDKGLIEFRGRPLVAYALEVLQPLAEHVLINANRNAERYAAFGHPVIPDRTESFDGPLAGLLAGLQTAQTPYALTLPVDTPLMTASVLQRLIFTLAQQEAEVCVPFDGVRVQPVVMMACCSIRADLEGYLLEGGRKVDGWLGRRRVAIADCSDQAGAFANVNTQADLALLEGAGSN